MIVLDTNFLLYCVKYRIIDRILDVGDKIIIPEPVFNEIRKIARERGIRGEYAGTALQIILKFKREGKVFLRKTEAKFADDSVLELAKKTKSIAGTLDAGLIKRLKKERLKVIKIRNKKGFIVD